MFEDPTPEEVPDDIRNRFQELNSLPEPVIEWEHLHKSSLHSLLQQIRPVSEFQVIERPDNNSTEVQSVAPRRVRCLEDDNRPLLSMAHIPWQHFAESLFYKGFVTWTRDIAWLWGTYGALREHELIRCCRQDPVAFRAVVQQNQTALSIAFFKAKLVDVKERGFTVLDGFAGPINPSFFNEIEFPFNTPENMGELQGRTQDHFFQGVYATLDRRAALRPNAEIDWKTILNYAVVEQDEADRAKGIAGFSTTYKFNVTTLMKTLMGRYMYFYDIYLGQLCSLVGLHSLLQQRLFISKSGGRFLVTGENCLAQCGHNDFDHRQPTGPGFFTIATGSGPCTLWVAGGSHLYVDYDDEAKRIMADVLEMGLIKIPAHSVFIGHGYLQHAGTAWSGSPCIRYHTYLIPQTHKLLNSVSFAYQWSFRKKGEPSRNPSEMVDFSGVAQHLSPTPGATTVTAQVGDSSGAGGEEEDSDDEEEDEEEDGNDIQILDPDEIVEGYTLVAI